MAFEQVTLLQGGGGRGTPSLCLPGICHFPGTAHEGEGTWVNMAQSLPEQRQWHCSGTIRETPGPVGIFHLPRCSHPCLSSCHSRLSTLCLFSSEPSTRSAHGECPVRARWHHFYVPDYLRIWTIAHSQYSFKGSIWE